MKKRKRSELAVVENAARLLLALQISLAGAIRWCVGRGTNGAFRFPIALNFCAITVQSDQEQCLTLKGGLERGATLP